MKNLIILLIIFTSIIYPQRSDIHGRVSDIENGHPLPNANIVTEDGSSGTVSDLKGEFIFKNINKGTTLRISYVGYETKNVIVEDPSEFLHIHLERKIISSQSVLILGSVGQKGVTPIAFDKVGKKEIEETYSVQDIPQFLANLPSVMSYSENGNGIGYNYLSIRGFDQRRISVTINGIPQNDPEDHNVYWLDFPDVLASTGMIQVQRGAGSGLFGYPAIGGSVNIITSTFADNPGLKFEAYLGSYNTKKYSASFSSGLIGDKYSVSAKLSRISSSGYRDLSWVNFNSYHLSAVRYDDRLTTQVNIYGGPIEDGLAYIGLPKFAVTNKDLRKENYSYWEADHAAEELTYTVRRRPEELENFTQPHYELLNELKLSDKINFNSALFLIRGSGFFDYDGSWADTSYLRIGSEFGFNPSGNPGNAIIRAQVENTQYGWLPRLSLSHPNGELIIGGELRIHRSDHWGSINYAENLPSGLSKDYRYYFYNGSKDIFGGFIQETFRPTSKLNLLGEVQFVYNKYGLYNERYLNNDFDVKHFFINPRLGVNYKFSNEYNVFISFAMVSREPRLKNYYDAAESSGGEVPQFERLETGLYDFENPLVKPETMNDLEIGSSYISDKINLSLNLFYMSFDDEIIKNGKLDRFGQPITGNAERTLHQGIELAAHVKLLNELELWGNASYSRNIIKEAKYFISDTEFINLADNRISGFPDLMANIGIVYSFSGIRAELTGKYVGEFYSDNYDKNLKDYLLLFPGFESYSDNKNESYFTADFTGSYELPLFSSFTPSKIYLRINNLFDKLYSAYAIGQEFFPAAERNFIAGVQIGL